MVKPPLCPGNRHHYTAMQQFRSHPVRDINDLTWLFGGADLDGTISLASRSAKEAYRKCSLTITARPSQASIKGKPAAIGNGVPVSGTRPSSGTPPRSLHYDATVEMASGASLASAATLLDRGDRFEVTLDPAPSPGMETPPLTATYLGPSHSADPAVIGEAIISKRTNVLLEYLRRINPHIADIAVADDTVYLDTSLEKMLPLNVFGAGVGRAVQIIACCLVRDSRILLIDQIEHGLHHLTIPPLLEALLTLTRERNVQVFATTHRLEILGRLRDVLAKDAFASDRFEVKCFALQRDRDGLVRSYTYDHAQFDHCIRHGLEMR